MLFPDEKVKLNLGPAIKRAVERARYDKEKDPVYLEHVEKVQKVIKERFLVLVLVLPFCL